jgi:hypothetical protein
VALKSTSGMSCFIIGGNMKRKLTIGMFVAVLALTLIIANMFLQRVIYNIPNISIDANSQAGQYIKALESISIDAKITFPKDGEFRLAKDIAVSISENTTIHVKMTSETLITKNNDVKVNPKIVNIHTNLPLVFKYKDNSVITIGNVRKNDGDIATDTLSMGLNTDATIALSRLLTNKVRFCERSEPKSEPFVGQARFMG